MESLCGLGMCFPQIVWLSCDIFTLDMYVDDKCA